MWKETIVGQLHTFLGLFILQDTARKPTIYSYHFTNHMLPTTFWGKYISRDRFALILKKLHLTDNENKDDSAYKFREVLDQFRHIFKSNYIPKENISIDESVTPEKKTEMERYIPLKRARFGKEPTS